MKAHDLERASRHPDFSLSVGAAELTQNESPVELLGRADAALYRAKDKRA